MKCFIIAPRQEQMVGHREDGYVAECIREKNHRGPHAIKTPEGIFMAWQDDWNCGCCTPEEDSRCTLYWKITEDDLPNLSQKQT